MAKPDVFIIESLDPDDEGNGRFEGSILSNFLRLHGKRLKYRYVRTREEFKEALKAYRRSNYRYLHISAHGEAEGLTLTNQEDIDFDELAIMLKPCLKNRRLFLSVCSMVHDDFAEEIILKTGCYSVVGPTTDIYFRDAVVFWIAAYHLIFKVDRYRIVSRTLKTELGRVRDLFNLDIAYYSKSKTRPQGFTKDLLAH
ncbi:hypothetical protein [Mesorhizobium sangaii]|uniref:CHAT domain-containing protein n=1 Tax=Mesorhizobium sangaii TaxID=505389 RepID=A0A841PIB9_9HYPH|nr:hypothetical protein [Mesorhizobium sangaii]MBB6412378.1 hypothetical protein [Mesorhizobium sangaii]